MQLCTYVWFCAQGTGSSVLHHAASNLLLQLLKAVVPAAVATLRCRSLDRCLLFQSCQHLTSEVAALHLPDAGAAFESRQLHGKTPDICRTGLSQKTAPARSSRLPMNDCALGTFWTLHRFSSSGGWILAPVVWHSSLRKTRSNLGSLLFCIHILAFVLPGLGLGLTWSAVSKLSGERERVGV